MLVFWSIIEAVGLAILLAIIVFFVIKLAVKNVRFEPIHLLAFLLVILISAILLSMFFYIKSIKSFVVCVKENASYIYSNGLIENDLGSSLSDGDIDFQTIKEYLKKEYPIIGDRIDDVCIEQLNSRLDCGQGASGGMLIKAVIDTFFYFIERKLTIVEYCTLIPTILMQILLVVLMLNQNTGSRGRTQYRQRATVYRGRRHYE